MQSKWEATLKGRTLNGAEFVAAWKAECNAASRLALIEREFCPPEPQLLDTCVLNNLDWVDRKLEVEGHVSWDAAAIALLAKRYGSELSEDLVDLGTLYKTFEQRGGYPWVVCHAALNEASMLKGPKTARLNSIIAFLAGHQDDLSADTYPDSAVGQLLGISRRPSTLLLRSLGVKAPEDVQSEVGPLAFLPDAGDRLTVAHALLANIPTILTTDRKSFWRHRQKILGLGVSILRPCELLPQYEQYWQMLEAEFARRRRESLDT